MAIFVWFLWILAPTTHNLISIFCCWQALRVRNQHKAAVTQRVSESQQQQQLASAAIWHQPSNETATDRSITSHLSGHLATSSGRRLPLKSPGGEGEVDFLQHNKADIFLTNYRWPAAFQCTTTLRPLLPTPSLSWRASSKACRLCGASGWPSDPRLVGIPSHSATATVHQH